MEGLKKSDNVISVSKFVCIVECGGGVHRIDDVIEVVTIGNLPAEISYRTLTNTQSNDIK